MVFLSTQSLILRPWALADTPALVQNANNRKVWINLKNLFPYPYTEEAARDWLAIANQIPLQNEFAIAHGGQAIGGIGLHRKEDVLQKTAEIGYWLGEPYWGRGFATEAVDKLTSWGFENFDLQRIQAGIFEWNQASMRLLEKAGYHLEAKLEKSVWKDGHLIDQFLFVKLR